MRTFLAPARKRRLLAIVGSRCVSFSQCAAIIRREIQKRKPEAVISGGASGVDSHAAMIAGTEFDLPVIVCTPAQRTWPHFRARNTLIAEICTELICIQSRRSATYGAEWTRDYAGNLGKPTKSWIVS